MLLGACGHADGLPYMLGIPSAAEHLTSLLNRFSMYWYINVLLCPY